MEAPATSETESPPAQSNPADGFSFTRYLLYFAVAVMVYFLSPGPLAKCLGPTNFDIPALRIVYAPIRFCADVLPAIDSFYEWYLTDV